MTLKTRYARSGLIAVFEAGHNLLDAMRILGSDCLADRVAVKYDKYVSQSDTWCHALDTIAAASRETWDVLGQHTGIVNDRLRADLWELAATPALATLTALEGICRGVGADYFNATWSVVHVTKGMAFPLPTRHLKNWRTTPHPATTHWDILEPDSGFVLWSLDWSLELDFTFRARLDNVCWPERNGEVSTHALAKIATVHPFSGHSEMAGPDEAAHGRFFWVHPATREPSQTAEANAVRIRDLLVAAAAHAPIAVVPEFSQHHPDALTALFNVHEGDPLPDIIVAGSAHLELDGARTNTSVSYIDGVPMLRTSKLQPFVFRLPDESGATVRYVEDLTPLPQVLRVVAGTSTRLTVPICSDLNSTDFVAALVSAGVNLMLCPAWTPVEGTFPAALAQAAGYSQCVGVVANTPGHPFQTDEAGAPFWSLSIVPRAALEVKRHVPTDLQVTVGVLDPNEAPDSISYWRWVV